MNHALTGLRLRHCVDICNAFCQSTVMFYLQYCLIITSARRCVMDHLSIFLSLEKDLAWNAWISDPVFQIEPDLYWRAKFCSGQIEYLRFCYILPASVSEVIVWSSQKHRSGPLLSANMTVGVINCYNSKTWGVIRGSGGLIYKTS